MNDPIILILSDSDLLYNALSYNLNPKNFIIDHIVGSSQNIKNFLTKYHKSTITIIDSGSYYNRDICKLSKYLFSFDIITNAVIFRKPFALLDLIQSITNNLSNTKLFKILDGVVYSEESSKIILTNDEVILLTAKENAIMRHLLLSQNHILSEDFLLEKIWKYSPSTETSTVSAHINALRAKLPQNMLENTDEGVKLYVENLF
ncbi:MAG UNVERIFIED_CONTAM: winged helix-turn-helix domain-containing protein [Rickettsiaceae bacterium]|jgi:hypothetical protein